MRRLLAGLAALALLGLAPVAARADDPLAAASLDRPDLGCHRLYFTPPGWGGPVVIEVCP